MHKPVGIAAATAAFLVACSVWLFAQQPGVHPISGRRFAPVMGYQGAEWLDRTERIEEENPDLALAALRIPRGAVVADVGAGSGYMTVKLARLVGPEGKVYANDIQPQMLDLLKRRASREGITNIEPVLGALDDPRLPADTLDLILMVDVYHEFWQPQAMLRKMHAALKADGRMVLLEYRKEDPSIPIIFEHKMSVAEAKLEVEAEGFRLAQVEEMLPRQHVLIFTKR
jgi:ubiquinone/menaquinone biosynthesis C-methylase UbiE